MNEVFTRNLKAWGKQNRRTLPWMGQKDPYRIWLSEVILQQTRVEQGLPYYERFLALFPNVHALAAAPEDQVFKAWEGLGYYSRARNLIQAARVVSEQYGGNFPSTYDGLRTLPGVGEYTAAAIASFAFDLPHAVVDGNVQRVLARFFGIRHTVDSTPGRKAFRELADTVLDPRDPAAWNQAMMDFGSQHCKPRQPLCSSCPLADHCVALARDWVAELPAKRPKAARRTRFFHYLVLEHAGKRYVRRRDETDIWAGLYDFPLIEKDQSLAPGELLRDPEAMALLQDGLWELRESSEWYRQALSHQDIRACFVKLSSKSGKLPKVQDWQALPPDKISKLAFPRVVSRYLDDQG